MMAPPPPTTTITCLGFCLGYNGTAPPPTPRQLPTATRAAFCALPLLLPTVVASFHNDGTSLTRARRAADRPA